MATWRPELTTKDSVLAFYENNQYVRYRVYAGTKADPNYIRWEYEGENKAEGLAELSIALDAILNNPTNINSYCFEIVRSDKVAKTTEAKHARKILDTINIVFQLNFPNSVLAFNPNVQSPGLIGQSRIEVPLEKMIEQQNALSSRFNAQILEEEEEGEEQPMGGFNFQTMLGQLMNKPQVQDLIINKIAGLLNWNTAPAAAIAGTPAENDQELKKAIDILKLYDDKLGSDLMILAQIAQDDLAQFELIIATLRQQKR